MNTPRDYRCSGIGSKLVLPAAAVAALAAAALPGCVRRTATFTSVPEGARLFLNDGEVGRTPATVEFTWYGDYDAVYRLEGYQAVHTHHRLAAPWYQLFPIDLFAEAVWPKEIHDHHDVPAQELTVLERPDAATLRERGIEFRERALFQSDTNAQDDKH